MKRNNSHIGFYTIGIVALFMAGFLLIVIFGANIYKGTVESQSQNSNTRAILSSISSLSRAETRGGIAVIDDDVYGQVLIVDDEDTDYAQKIYSYDGALVEELSLKTEDIDPASAQVIGMTEKFEISKKADDMLVISTDAGEVMIHAGKEAADER